MNQLRKVCSRITDIKDKYYVTDDGSFYVVVSSNKVMRKGERRTITKHILSVARASQRTWTIPFKDWGTYCLVLKNGLTLRRLTTYKRNNDQIIIALITTLDKEVRRYVSRVVAEVFLGSIEGMEVHHIDRDRTNNNISNLEILSFEDHRSKESFKLKHG